MTSVDERLQEAGDYLAQASTVLDEMERGIAVAQPAEVIAWRTGRVLLIGGALVLGTAAVVGSAVVLRRLLEDRETDTPPRLPVENIDGDSVSTTAHAQASRNGD